MKETLTARQQKTLDFLNSYIKLQGYPPTLREISSHMGIKSHKNALKHLEALERKSYIRRSLGVSRGLEIVNNLPSSSVVNIPVVGSVAAGPPKLAVENIEEHMALDSEHFDCDGTFLLKVTGESMIDGGIDDGDYVLIKPSTGQSPSELQGKTVVAMIDDEATVKTFSSIGEQITLFPKNPEMKPIKVDPSKEFSIVGAVISIIKKVYK